jgi:plasmid stability protein
MATDTSKLVLRLPAALHRKLRDQAAAHERSLNGEIVYALRHYVAGVREIRQVWGAADEADEQSARDWTSLAGETLRDDEDGWEFTPDEREEVAKLMEGQREAPVALFRINPALRTRSP